MTTRGPLIDRRTISFNSRSSAKSAPPRFIIIEPDKSIPDDRAAGGILRNAETCDDSDFEDALAGPGARCAIARLRPGCSMAP